MQSLTEFTLTRTLTLIPQPRLIRLARFSSPTGANLSEMASSTPRGRGHRGRPRSRGGFRSSGQGPASAGQSRGVTTSAIRAPDVEHNDISMLSNGTQTPTSAAREGPRFRDFPELSEVLLRALPFERCTEVSDDGQRLFLKIDTFDTPRRYKALLFPPYSLDTMFSLKPRPAPARPWHSSSQPYSN